MVAPEELLRRCHVAAVLDIDDPTSPDSLIGFFQRFRPDGNGLAGIFDDLPGGEHVHDRLAELFRIAGDDRRPDGRRDAYFLVWTPAVLSPQRVSEHAKGFLQGVAAIARAVGDEAVVEALDPLPNVRVLEGKAPKNPKDAINQSSLLQVFQQRVPRLTEQIESADPIAATLRPAFYFISCDAMLRDHLMWPLYADAMHTNGMTKADPLADYFALWRHGIKFRIIRHDTIDFYIPRPPMRIPIEAISGGI